MLTDNCSPVDSLRVTFKDIEQNECPNNGTIRREWRVEDLCGNVDTASQFIQFIDTLGPAVTRLASDLVMECDGRDDVDTLFNDWLQDYGGARAQDNCTPQSALNWFAYVTGTRDTAFLPPPDCNEPGATLQEQTVTFIVEDECGNRDSTTATFSKIDTTAPVIRDCPDSLFLATDPGECFATYTFLPPPIEENCGFRVLTETVNETVFLSSSAEPGNENNVPVNPITLTFELQNPRPLSALTSAELLIELVDVDGEESTEVFGIFGEDDAFLGQTNNTPAQCDTSQTILTLTRAQIENWGLDGVITIRLEPNQPEGQPGRAAINDICPEGKVNARLSFQQKDLQNLTFQYSVNNGERVVISPPQETTLQLPTGNNLIQYFVRDCAGLQDSCSYVVRVEDREAPNIVCPEDRTVQVDTSSCQAEVTLPLPQAVTDNCDSFARTIRTDTSFLTFRNDPDLDDPIAEDQVLEFTGLAANALGPVTLELQLKGDLSSNGAFFIIEGEDGAEIGQTSEGIADCTTSGQQVFTIPAADFNRWAADGQLLITARVNEINIPPGMQGDGINPCDPNLIEEDGDTDGKSYIKASINYPFVTPAYFAEGATEIPLTFIDTTFFNPTHIFELGETTVYYIVEDSNGNADTCSYNINLTDGEPPVALCQPTTVFINPSGISEETISAAEIDAGSTDNCGIDTMFVMPNTFTCEDTGRTPDVTLTVIDRAGLSSTCTVPVRVENLKPQPTANSGICGNDTLFLQANPPPAEGGIIFQYQWTGPNGFTSDVENPVIPNVDSDNAGSYSVQITGITGCQSTGIVEVSIEDLPLTPILLTEENVCVEDDIVLESSVVPQGFAVYRWYRGAPPEGELLATTSEPSYTIPAPHTEGGDRYYLTIEAEGCVSAPATPVRVTRTAIPVATVNANELTICEGESITLGTSVTGEGVTYEWTGPDGYRSTSQFPSVIPEAGTANSGVYRLVVTRNGCSSNPAFTVVNVLAKPERPELSNNGPVCEDESVVLTTNIDEADRYVWISPNLQEIITTTNRLTISQSNLGSAEGRWRLYVTRFGCDSELSDPSEVVVNTRPDAVASTNANVVCQGDQLQLFASPGIPGATYRWTGPNDFTSVSQNPVINDITAARQGAYQVTITTAENCSNTATVEVFVQERVRITAINSNPQGCITGPTDIELRATVFPLDNGSYRYRWTGPGGFSSTDSVAVIPNATEVDNGNYQLIVEASGGCASDPASTVVDVNDPPERPDAPLISESTPAPFCEGDFIRLVTEAYTGNEVTYKWKTPRGEITTFIPSLNIDEATFDDSGSYSVSVVVNGCESAASAENLIRIGARPAVSITSNSPVCSGDEIQLSSSVIPGATYSWMGPGFTSSIPNPVIPNANQQQHDGSYTLTVSRNGCTVEETITVSVAPKPRTPGITSNGPLCISTGDSILQLAVLEGTRTINATYQWFDENGLLGISTRDTFLLDELDRYPDGEQQFYVRTVVGDCQSDPSPPVSVGINQIPMNQAFAGDDFSACAKEVTELQAEAPLMGAGMWSLVTEDSSTTTVSITNPDQPNSTVSGLQGGRSYLFRWQLSNGACRNYSADSVVVQVAETEVVDAGADQVLCATQEVSLNANPIGTSEGTWSQSDAQRRLGVRILQPQDPNTLVQGLEPGNQYSFTWTVNGGCGESSDEVFIVVSDPAPYAGPDATFCNDAGFGQLQATAPTEGSTGRWSTPDSNVVFSNRMDPMTNVRNLSPGETVFVWSIDGGICGENSRDTVRVTFKANPLARPDTVEVGFATETALYLLDNDSVPTAASINIVSEPVGGTLWETDTLGKFLYKPRVDFVGKDLIMYELCSDACECSMTRVELQVGDDASCSAPNIFTPNNDNVNDRFVVPCLLDTDRFPESQVSIYNRWGDEVFRSEKPYRNDWRGTFNGEDLPSGTYFYVVDFGDGRRKKKSGYVMIQR